MNALSTPVALLIFNRPELTRQVFDAIAQARPPKLFVVADGPRPERATDAEKCGAARAIVERIDWPCEVVKNYSEVNLGCGRRVSSGLDWLFSQVEEAIILEDDCLPALSFFPFCQALLERYRDDQRVFMIGGNNFQFGRLRTRYSYYFSRYPEIWGWASWKRAWKHFDPAMSSWPEFKADGYIKAVFENPREQEYWSEILEQCYQGKINSWAYIWCYTCWSQSALTILPDVNLVSN